MGTIGRFICPACNATNVQSGNCFKCGADLSLPQADRENQDDQLGPASQSQQSSTRGSLRSIQSSCQLTKQQMVLMAAGALLILSFFLMFGGHSPSPQPTAPPVSTTTQDNQTNNETAIAVATHFAGFKDTPPPNWTYEDTSALTGEMPSFALKSKLANQNALFIVWDNQEVVKNLQLLLTKVPFTDLATEKLVALDQGEGVVGSGPFKWQVSKYNRSKDSKTIAALVGAFKSPVAGKAIVVIAQPFEATEESTNQESANNELSPIFDYKTSLWLVDTMAANYTNAAKEGSESTASNIEDQQSSKETAAPKPLATETQLDEYRKQVENSLNQKFQLPKEQDSKPITIVVGLTKEGTINKIEITKSSGDEMLDQAFVKAITSGQPYKPVPHTQANTLSISATAEKGKVKVEL